MRLAAGIELRLTFRAAARLKVVGGAQLVPAHPAEHRRFFVPLRRPHLRGAAGELLVALEARIIALATGALDGDDVNELVIVSAPSLRIYFNSMDSGAGHQHRLISHAA